jgi:hypothetical protein
MTGDEMTGTKWKGTKCNATASLEVAENSNYEAKHGKITDTKNPLLISALTAEADISMTI